MKKPVNIIILTIVVALAILFGRNLMPSEFSNCVIVESEQNFTGERLKYSSAVSHGRKLTTECIEIDNKLDNGNGPKEGIIRWAKCPNGPDCDEIGMY